MTDELIGILKILASNVPAAVAVILMAVVFMRFLVNDRKSQRAERESADELRKQESAAQELRHDRFFTRLGEIQNGSNEVIKENTQVNQKMCDRMDRILAAPPPS